MGENDDVHVVPATTMSERMHVLTDGCWCGTTTEPVKRDDGSVGWVVTHRRAAPVSAGLDDEPR